MVPVALVVWGLLLVSGLGECVHASGGWLCISCCHHVRKNPLEEFQ